jgi:gliding motility-associated-like protein
MKNFPKWSASIYDRYGKLIINLNSSKYSWDGKFNNNPLPADDYWYRLKLDNTIPEVKGHFSLKR